MRTFKLANQLKSFQYAGRGIKIMVQTQHNAWIHVGATIIVLASGWGLRITRGEWLAIIFAIVVVWVAEAFNTALEFLADACQPTFHPLVGRAKDVAAGGVLIAAIGATIIGLLVFAPYGQILLCNK